MTHIVITGGTRGIGKGLALEFLKHDCRVTIAGRNQATIRSSVESLRKESGSNACQGIRCDVTKPGDLENLWEEAVKMEPVDIWINNAGINHPARQVTELSDKEIEAVLSTNIQGTILGAKVALKGMMEQGFGSLYNMEGLGSDGRIIAGTSVYGTCKSAIRYFTRSLIKEFRDSKIRVGTISPGIVITDMILAPIRERPEQNRDAIKIFHILADPPERVTPWIVRKILSNSKHGRHIAWLTPLKISRRFVLNMVTKRRVEGLPEL
jgi:NAD(P)-dependent dehydrogenase (short-subunit alcohol dehydrogenase family)